MRGPDKPGGFQDRSHLVRRVYEDAKGASSDPQEKVHHRESRAEIPAVGRVGDGQQAARSCGRRAEQRARVGITADDAVEGNNVRLGQRGGGRRKITKDELRGMRAIPRADVAARKFEIGGRSVGERGAGQARGGEFPSDHANAGADIEKLEILELPAAEFGEEHARTGVRAASLVSAQITICNAGVEEARSCAMTGAACHAWHLSGVKAVDWRV